MQRGYRRAQLAKSEIAGCTYTCCACCSSFPRWQAPFPKWKSAATAALSARKRNRRTLSMAAQPFILTIDSGRRFIDKVIVGGYDDDGNKDPSMLTFVYKTGFTNSVDANNHKPPRKKRKKNKEKNMRLSGCRIPGRNLTGSWLSIIS